MKLRKFVMGFAAFFPFTRRRKSALSSGYAGQERAVQDQQDNWWVQDPTTATWYIWNGQRWKPVPGAAPRIPMQPDASAPGDRSHRSGSCLLTLLVSGLTALLLVGGISLVAYNFFPAYHIYPGQGDLGQILKMGGGGLLSSSLGLLLLNGSFRAFLPGHADPRGCGALLNGLGQLFFGLFFLTIGLALMTLAFYQEILPWLGL